MFKLAFPWLLLLLPLPLLIRWLMPSGKVQENAALKVPFFNAIQQMLGSATSLKGQAPLIHQLLLYSAWGLLIIALAGPQWLGAPVELPRSGRDIMLAVDLSGSMQIPDMSLNGKRVDRLTVVKQAASRFIKKREGDRVGLILFGTKAYLQTPLTFDRKTVAEMLDDASIGLAGEKTAIGDAIGLAIKRLSKASEKSRVLILLTDGGNNAGMVKPLEAAKMAAKQGIRIFTIGLGANRLVVPSIFGPRVISPTSDLDEKTLKEIAEISHGLFFRAENTTELNNVYKSIDKLVPVQSDKDSFRPIKPLYPWPLGLALLISLWFALRRVGLLKLDLT